VSTLQLEARQHLGKTGEAIVVSGESRYQLRYHKDQRYSQERMLAEKLYAVLGVPTPPFIIVSNVTCLPKELQILAKYMPYVKIQPLVIKNNATNDDAQGRIAYFQSHYVTDAFLGNVDAGSGKHEVVYSAGQFYRVDIGSALQTIGSPSIKVKSKKKSERWDPYLLPEMKILQRNNKEIYGTVSDTRVTTQARIILSKAAELAEAFEEIATALMFGADMRKELANMLARRLQLLQMLVSPGTAFRADASRPVSSLTAAGMFITCTLNGTPQVLLGARKSSHVDSNNTWVTLGGKSELSDDTSLLQTANREIYEETTGLLNILAPLMEAPFHDLVHTDYMYRLYFVRMDSCFDVEALHQARRPASLRHNVHTGAFEYNRFQWFPLQAMQAVSVDGTIGTGPEVTYRPFAALLQTPHVQSMIGMIERNQTVVTNRYTQSTPAKGGVTTSYGAFQDVGLGEAF
jgi:8-oxo-dGTP pyrophosphatase MutT (NUDIX family)